jgi:hypothetical protein
MDNKLDEFLPDAQTLRETGAKAVFFGVPASDLSRDDLLALIGLLGEVQIFQSEQLTQSAKNQLEILSWLKKNNGGDDDRN